MKKIILFLSMAFMPFIQADYHNKSKPMTWEKRARIAFRLLETGAGVGFGVWGIKEAMQPGFFTNFINSFKAYAGVHFGSSLKPQIHGGVISTNRPAAFLILAGALLHDGLTNLNKELNTR